MNIKKLNEAIEKVLNEYSDETKEKVLAIRKEQAAKANAKLQKSINLMAKQNIGSPSSIQVTFTDGCCETIKDNYKKGADPNDYGSSWDNDKEVTFDLPLDSNFRKILAKNAGEYLYTWWIKAEDINGVESDGSSLRFSTEVNETNREPSDSEWEDFKKGDIDLWIADGYISLEINENDIPYFLKACEKADIDLI